MGRWEPDARGRLLSAALELVGERGYERTTTAAIAERAGLTKTTLFRLFADKREILFQGQPALVEAAARAVDETPPDADAAAMLAAAVGALAGLHDPDRRATGQRIEDIVAANPELRERYTTKRAAITAALEGALEQRIGDPRRAGILAEVGVRAYYEGWMRWLARSDRRSFASVALAELDAQLAALDALAGMMRTTERATAS